MKTTLFSAIPLVLVLLCSTSQPVPAAGVPGAIFTTNATGTVVNSNLFNSKCAVYLDGGPGPNAPAKAAGLPDGEYYFQVTDPSGATLLSTDPVSNRKFRVSRGVITAYTGTGGPAHPTGVDQDHSALGAITIRLANLNCPTDFINTPNAGDVYKVWVTPVSSFNGNAANVDNACSGNCFHGFVASQSKTDNFKAVASQTTTFCLTIQKMFTKPDMDPFENLLGWGMTVTDTFGVTNRYTTDDIHGEIQICQLPVGSYTVAEDPSGPLPAACDRSFPLKSTLNGVEQPAADTVPFGWTSSSPVTIVFVNQLVCTTSGPG